MYSLSTRLRALMCEYQMNLEKLTSLSGLPTETVRNLLYDRAQEPFMNTFLPLCNVFHISPESLSGIPMSAPETLFLEQYYGCSSHSRQFLSHAAALQAKASGHEILCFCPPVLTASRITFYACNLKMISSEYREAYFAIQLPDNLFSPYYCRGDILLFADRFPREGEHALILYQNEVLFRSFHQEAKKSVLIPVARDSAPITVRQVNQLCVIGTCTGKKQQ